MRSAVVTEGKEAASIPWARPLAFKEDTWVERALFTVNYSLFTVHCEGDQMLGPQPYMQRVAFQNVGMAVGLAEQGF